MSTQVKKEFQAYCGSANLKFYKVGWKSTFRTKTRNKVLDLILVSRSAWNRVSSCHVSDVLLFSGHMCVNFAGKNSVARRKQKIGSLHCTRWDKYIKELNIIL